MSSIEERLVRDIAAVTGGVVVTESDLRDARKTLDERIESRRRQNRVRGVLMAAAAAVVVLVLGIVAIRALDGDDLTAPPANPSPSDDPFQDFLVGSAPTSEGIRGVWREDNGTTLVRFSAPNAVSFDTHGRMFGNPEIQGTYQITGDQITVSVTGGRGGCAGQEFVMRASMPGDGNLRVAHIRSGTGDCSGPRSLTWVLEHVAPAGPAFMGLDNSSATDWQPLPVWMRLDGSWFAEGGGYVLQLDRSGAYYVVDDSSEAVDQGRWSRHGRRLTLTGSGESGGCDAGDRMVLRDLETTNPGTVVIRSTVQENTCGVPWATRVWILIPHEGS